MSFKRQRLDCWCQFLLKSLKEKKNLDFDDGLKQTLVTMPETVGDYVFSKNDLIGHGAFAVVFKGRHRKVSFTGLWSESTKDME